MLRQTRLVVIVLAAILTVSCRGPLAPDDVAPTPTLTSIATPAKETIVSPAPSPTPSPEPTPTPSPTSIPTATPIPTPAPMASPSVQASPTSVPVAPAITVKQADTTQKIVALTFGAGSDAGHAVEILDMLKQQGIRATFAVTGRWAEQNPELVKRMAAEGHQIINYTYDHKSFTGFSTGQPALTTQQRDDELSRTRDIILSQTGYDVQPYFRPPYGDVDGSVLQDIAEAGYSVNVTWSLDSLGWSGLKADEIVARTLGGVTPGAVVLMQAGGQSEDAIALPKIVESLRDAGYQFVTVKQMVGR